MMSREYRVGKFFIRVNWLIAACVLITSITFLNLGIWQLGRAAEKVEEQEALELELQQNAGPIEAIPLGHLHRANPEMQNRHVLLNGHYINEKTILVLAEFFDGQIGYGVVTPFRLAETDGLVLVHRGWTSGILPADTQPATRPRRGTCGDKSTSSRSTTKCSGNTKSNRHKPVAFANTFVRNRRHQRNTWRRNFPVRSSPDRRTTRSASSALACRLCRR